jgi:hypothetical protein
LVSYHLESAEKLIIVLDWVDGPAAELPVLSIFRKKVPIRRKDVLESFSFF